MLEHYLPSVWRVGGAKWGLSDHPVLSAVGDPSVYLVRLARGHVLVDCGTIAGRAAIETNLREAGVEPANLTDLLITHSHADHTEGAADWRADHGLRIHLHELGAEYLDRNDYRLLGDLAGPAPLRYAPFPVDHRVRDGETFPVAGTAVTAWEVPGHTPDSMLYVIELDGQRLGFSGDICFGPADWDPAPGNLGSLSRMWKSNINDYRDSLVRMAGMPLDVLLPGHGHIIVGADAVQRNIAGALTTIEGFLATPRIYVMGMTRRKWEPPPVPRGRAQPSAPTPT